MNSKHYNGLKLYEGLEVREDEKGSLFFNPKTCRTYRVKEDGSWEDVSLAFPLDDETDMWIRWQNMVTRQSNYMPKFLPPPDITEDVDFEEV